MCPQWAFWMISGHQRKSYDINLALELGSCFAAQFNTFTRILHIYIYKCIKKNTFFRVFLGFCLQLVAAIKVECGAGQPGSGSDAWKISPRFLKTFFAAMFCQVEGLLNNGPGYSSLLGKISDFRWDLLQQVILLRCLMLKSPQLPQAQGFSEIQNSQSSRFISFYFQ